MPPRFSKRYKMFWLGGALTAADHHAMTLRNYSKKSNWKVMNLMEMRPDPRLISCRAYHLSTGAVVINVFETFMVICTVQLYFILAGNMQCRMHSQTQTSKWSLYIITKAPLPIKYCSVLLFEWSLLTNKFYPQTQTLEPRCTA